MSTPEETTDPSTAPAPTPAEEPDDLAQVGERIDKARAQAEEAGVLADDDEDAYVESGSDRSEDLDDQTITPPG